MAVTTAPQIADTQTARIPGRMVSAVRAHWLFGVVLAAGVALRVVTMLAYRPALLYIDSLSYVANSGKLDPTGARPVGYSIFIRPFLALGDLQLIPTLHHLMGLGLGVGIYVLLLRAGARRWVAALASAPVLLDAYQLQIEQNVLSETLFQVLLFTGLVLLVDGAGRPRSLRRRLATAALAGLVLGLAVPVRLIGQFLAPLAAGYLLLAVGYRWRQRILVAVLFVALFAAPVLSYMTYFRGWAGEFGMTSIGGRMIYGRTAVLVDCERIDIPAAQRDLCPPEPLGQRQKIDNYVWNGDSPLNGHQPPPGMTHDESLRAFGMHVIRQQPVDFLVAVTTDMMKNFWWTKAQFEGDVDVGRWQFQLTYPRYGRYYETLAAFDAWPPQLSLPLATWLRTYQLSVGYTPGTLLGVGLLIGLVAACGLRGARGSPLRLACLLWTTCGALITMLPAVYEFSWRYMLPALVTAPVAAGLGITALTARTRQMTATAHQPSPQAVDADPIDDTAVAKFADEYGAPTLGPLAVVIAAYNEEEALGAVLTAMPATIEAQPVSTVVVDDGSTDATAEVARKHGALVLAPGRNRGQGAALRLGYRVAREHGATYIATLDADGQYEPAELRAVLLPLLGDEADFVTGSRRLGNEHTTDRFRRLGVRFYAWMITRLTGQHITDTSNGLRAMRAEVTATVSLTQPQYQASELLIGTLAHGYRVVEVPTTMRERTAGESKKGNNLLYGARFGAVVVSSWLRERARRRALAERRTPGDPAARTSPETAPH